MAARQRLAEEIDKFGIDAGAACLLARRHTAVLRAGTGDIGEQIARLVEAARSRIVDTTDAAPAPAPVLRLRAPTGARVATLATLRRKREAEGDGDEEMARVRARTR